MEALCPVLCVSKLAHESQSVLIAVYFRFQNPLRVDMQFVHFFQPIRWLVWICGCIVLCSMYGMHGSMKFRWGLPLK